MFLCLPEFVCSNPLVKKHPASALGASHLYAAIKQGQLPMFIGMLRARCGGDSRELVALAPDARSLWRLNEYFSALRVVGLSCVSRGAGSWVLRTVKEVWTEPGHEMLAVYLEFHEEPGMVFDAITLRAVEKEADVTWQPLFEGFGQVPN